MEYEKEKTDKMYAWMTQTLPVDVWVPEGERTLTEDQAIYIERILETCPEMRYVEFNRDFTKIRKADLCGYRKYYGKKKN